MNTQKLLWLGAAGAGIWLAWRALGSRLHYSFRDKVVIITGGSRGLGLVMARKLAREGAILSICAREADEVMRAQDELANMGARVFGVVCDVSDQQQVAEFVARTEERFGRVDVLINNASIISVGPIQNMTLEDFQENMAINYWGCVHTILAALPGMRRRGEGRIVNISSIGGKIGVPHLVPYCGSKFAVVGLSEGLRSELGREGITVTTVCPGLMRTGSPRNAFFKGQNEAEYAWFAISDSMPFVSLSAENAAGKILRACRRGEANIIVGLPAQAAILLHDLFPGPFAQALGLVNRMLPGPGGIGTGKARGFQSESAAAPSVLTMPSDRAARRNNEMVADPV